MREPPTPDARPFRWSWRIAAPFGIGVYLHVTFVLLLAWVVIGGLAAGHGAALTIASASFLLAIFGIVVLHELGHAAIALHFGIRTRAITLLPIGGVASLERTPERPRQELLIALAGPMVNILIAVLLAVLLSGLGEPLDAGALTAPRGHVLVKLFWVNVSLAAFNLLPAFPMDGGRALRALLAMRVGRARATAVAVSIGKAFAVALGFVGLWANPMLTVIAVFIWVAASSELRSARIRAALAGVPVGDAMIREVTRLHPAQRLQDAAERIVAGYAHDFPVVEDGTVRGVLTHADVVRGLSTLGPDSSVARSMHRDVTSISRATPLDRAFGRLQHDANGVIVVTEEGSPVGLLSLPVLAEYLALKMAVDRGRHRPTARAIR